MKTKVKKLRLSPNEEARILREELERRRKLRIQQVREQQRHIALQIRQEVERRRQQELEHLGEELRQDWERQQREKLQTLQSLYQESLQLIGQGHRSAKENEPDLAAVAQREEENHIKAEERYREALKELKSQKSKDHEMQSRAINARKKALQAEKERSAKVASLPPPPPNPIQQYVDFKKPHVVKKFDVSAFADTHYHMSVSVVDRELHTQQPNAHERAELELRRLQDLQKEESWKREEQLEKARVRGKQALRREQLIQDRERWLVELEHMQQTDLLRRRQQVSQIPPQVFYPLYKRQEVREDFQKEMEFAFEDMYTGERRVKGDLVVQLVPEPLPAPSTGSQDQELDVTAEEITTSQTENTQCDTDQEVESAEQETSVQVESSQPKAAPRRALKKLLDRIRSQRSHWPDHHSPVPAAASSVDSNDQIPEQDSTIDTGSLSSGEGGKLPTLHPADSAQKTTEEPLSQVLPNRIQDFEEQKKKQEDLEREKQQQLIMLQELEEQKAKLEQLLMEAQQEREHLKVAVTQDLPVEGPEAAACDHEVASMTPALSTVPGVPAGEAEHRRRIKEYQRRLLEQNRIHSRSVEVARQRLDEYQRALRIRYSMTCSSFVPTETQRPLLKTQSVNNPVPLLLPMTPVLPDYVPAELQTSVDVPMRESERLASPASSVDSTSLPDEVESKSNGPRNQFQDVTAWLTNNIMERVTQHLPQAVRSSSSNIEPLSCKSPHSTGVPLHPASDSIQAVSTSVTDGAAVAPGNTDAHTRSLLQRSLQPAPMSSDQNKLENQRQKLQIGSLSSTEHDLENQRRELQEVKKWVLDQREAVALQQRQQEEHRHRREVELEHMRRQKETLQALIHTDAHTAPAAADEAQDSENIKQTRLKLLASLLRAIEVSNGGTLSHLEEPGETDGSPERSTSTICEKSSITENHVPAEPGPAWVLPSGPFPPPPPRAAKPPVTRVRLGIMEMTEQHELSAIQEVETPVDTSLVTGREDSVPVLPRVVDSGAAWDSQEDSEMSVPSDVTMQTPSVTSSGQDTDEGPTSSGTFNSLMWREKLLSSVGTSPDSAASVLKLFSPLSSDSGRGADYSGPAVTAYGSHTESRRADSDSSTTISTGSYVTTDPEQNADKSLLVRRGVEQERLNISSRVRDPSAAAPPALTVHAVFNDSSIQQIIDRYTRELNISLSTAGRTTDSEASCVEDHSSSASQRLEAKTPEEPRGEDEGSACNLPLPSDTAGTQRCEQEHYPVPEHNLSEDMLLAEDPDQDSFRPLTGRVADESSLLTADHREAAMEQLLGHPSAHSSMIGPASVSLDPAGWDSTLSRMIGRLSHQAGSHWLSRGQDFYAGQLLPEQSMSWLVEDQEESQMRPLVMELDDDDDDSGSSGERTRVDVGASAEASAPSHPQLHPAGVSGPVEQSPERTEGPDSFRSLLAEFTHNETAEPSMTFDLPEHGPHSPGEESDCTEPSDSSPERLRAEEQSCCLPASCQSFSSLTTSHYLPHESVLMVSPTVRTDGGLSDLPTCDATPALDIPLPQEVASEKGILEQSDITLVSLTDTTITEDEGAEEDKHVDGVMEESQSTLSETMPEDRKQLQPVTFLEFQWCPSNDLQDVHQLKRTALLHKSRHRVEDMKARRALTNTQPEHQAPCAANEQSKSGAQPKTEDKSEERRDHRHQATEKRKQKKAQPPPTAAVPGLKKLVEVKLHTPEQRKKDVSEMYQRTQRLYEQLEEVKQQKVMRSRQAASAENRLKAKEFHKKTLQKLRAKH